MGFIDLGTDLGDIEEAKAVPPGRYDLRVVQVKNEPSKTSGKPMVSLLHEIIGHPEAAPVSYYLSLPTEGDEPKARTFKLLNIRRYLSQFNTPFETNGFNEEDLYGAEGNVQLGMSEPTEQYPIPRNEMQLDRLKDEQVQQKATGTGSKKKR
jgi:hypothetical protein